MPDEIFNIDADPDNADWTKVRSWDIWTPGYTKLVTTPEELVEAIAPMTIEEFLRLPAAKAMPAELKSALKSSSAP